ncbi:MAG TPA: hypothetical protein VFR67_05365 [Pilimelia sp.]|nr:hypothetical protein [Pilimelia sp.]
MIRVAGWLAIAGGALAAVAGAVAAVAGDTIPEWTGNKQAPELLGTVTVGLGLLAGACGWWLSRAAARPAGAPTARLLAAAAILAAVGVVGFTTVGTLWYVPGPLLLAAAALVIAEAARRGDAGASLRRLWLPMLTAVPALGYLLLAGTASPAAAAAGVFGGLAVLAALVVRRRRRLAYALLLAGALPFAIITWWSIVTPVLAVVILVLGHLSIVDARRTASADSQKILVNPVEMAPSDSTYQ